MSFFRMLLRAAYGGGSEKVWAQTPHLPVDGFLKPDVYTCPYHFFAVSISTAWIRFLIYCSVISLTLSAYDSLIRCLRYCSLNILVSANGRA